MNHNQQTVLTFHTFDDVQQYMDSVDLDALSSGQQALLPDNVTNNIRHLADVYAMIRPVLGFIGSLPIFPGSWRRALQLLFAAVESLLAITEPLVPREDQREDFKAGRDLEEVTDDREQFKAGRDLEE